MDVERVTGVVRPRSQWEAVDFGFALARRWRRPLWTAWMATVAPAWWLVYGVVAALAGPWVALAVLWWLRPLASRVPLLILSRALFGEISSPRVVLAEVPRLWARNLAGDLTFRRLDFARSFHLPVYQLEGLAGGTRRRRLAVLRQDRYGTAVALTLVGLVMEASVFLSSLVLVVRLPPEGFGIDWRDHFGSLFRGGADPWFVVVFGACAFLALTVVEPFYVGGGFALYLDRRTHLEGWDVELAFRRLARRLEARGRRGHRGATAALLALALAAVGAGAVEPEGAGSGKTAAGLEKPASGVLGRPAEAPRDPRELVRELLADPDFATRRRVEGWQLREDLLERDPETRDGALELPVALLAVIGEVLLWGLAIALLAVLVVAVVRHARPWSAQRRREGGASPTVLFGHDLSPEHLPADVPAAARDLFAAGRATEALGLLYRGALARLAQRRQVAASWTEEECVRQLAGQLDTAAGAWFRNLAGAWQAAAYAHRPPEPPAFGELCGDWARHLGAGGPAAPAPAPAPGAAT